MAKMPSVMSHKFSEVPRADIPRSKFNRSHGYKTTFDAGQLIPIYVDEALPGDTHNLKMSGFGRLATPLHPFMDNLFLETFYFAVPLRLIWDNFQKFNGEQDNPGDSTDYLVPTMTSPTGGYLNSSLSDYFGIPTQVEALTHTSLYHRAYNLIWNEWFRDQNLQDSITVDKGDGPDDPANYVIKKRGKRHDYFTSCLPWPQKGPAVELPLGDTAPVETREDVTNDLLTLERNSSSGASSVRVKEPGGPAGTDLILTTDLSDATAATINQLRQAFQIQKLYERDARGGTRYTEILKSHFGVTSPDARLQRPEYLGGGTTTINVNPVAQTSSSTVDSPQGELAGVGTALINNHGFTKSFTEHCVIIGMACVRADLNYQQGLNRHFSRSTRWDYYWPALAHIGEQAVLNKEIFAQGDSNDEDVFGYQERFAEYRYKPSTITGQFRSNYAQTLDAWHLAQDFENLPVLNDEFIEEDPPVDRVIAIVDQPHLIFDSYNHLTSARPMPTYSVPGLIDHF
ncbi:major capsid protein [Microviridae sp.]|nr:major capsid protein [Microviridae sp.]